MRKTILIMAIGIAVCAFYVLAQDAGSQRPEGKGGGHPPFPIEAALDANKDKTIDADEIANASSALKKLDKNGDGKLTPDELRPARPDRADKPQQKPDR